MKAGLGGPARQGGATGIRGSSFRPFCRMSAALASRNGRDDFTIRIDSQSGSFRSTFGISPGVAESTDSTRVSQMGAAGERTTERTDASALWRFGCDFERAFERGILRSMLQSFSRDVSDELSVFRESEENGTEIEAQAATRFSCELLMFDYDGEMYAVSAACVDGVIPWKAPAVVPEVEAKVSGVIQDRGRIVVVMSHPSGDAEPEAHAPAKRIVICATPRGHIGLPATATHAVGMVELTSKPLPFGVYDSKLGTFTYLDPSRYVEDSPRP